MIEAFGPKASISDTVLNCHFNSIENILWSYAVGVHKKYFVKLLKNCRTRTLLNLASLQIFFCMRCGRINLQEIGRVLLGGDESLKIYQ